MEPSGSSKTAHKCQMGDCQRWPTARLVPECWNSILALGSCLTLQDQVVSGPSFKVSKTVGLDWVVLLVNCYYFRDLLYHPFNGPSKSTRDSGLGPAPASPAWGLAGRPVPSRAAGWSLVEARGLAPIKK